MIKSKNKSICRPPSLGPIIIGIGRGLACLPQAGGEDKTNISLSAVPPLVPIYQEGTFRGVFSGYK